MSLAGYDNWKLACPPEYDEGGDECKECGREKKGESDLCDKCEEILADECEAWEAEQEWRRESMMTPDEADEVANEFHRQGRFDI